VRLICALGVSFAMLWATTVRLQAQEATTRAVLPRITASSREIVKSLCASFSAGFSVASAGFSRAPRFRSNRAKYSSSPSVVPARYVDVVLMFAWAYWKVSAFEQARDAVSRAIAASTTDDERAEHTTTLARIHQQTGDLDRATSLVMTPSDGPLATRHD